MRQIQIIPNNNNNDNKNESTNCRSASSSSSRMVRIYVDDVVSSANWWYLAGICACWTLALVVGASHVKAALGRWRQHQGGWNCDSVQCCGFFCCARRRQLREASGTWWCHGIRSQNHCLRVSVSDSFFETPSNVNQEIVPLSFCSVMLPTRWLRLAPSPSRNWTSCVKWRDHCGFILLAVSCPRH